jgi:hypothetical protein
MRSSFALTAFEILDVPFVLLRRCLAVEGAEIFAFARSRIFLARIQPILTGFQFPDHNRALNISESPLMIRARREIAREFWGNDPGCPT